MRYALIDDATLESAKRMEGIIPGNNTLEVAGDILALENLIQAILFCDEILYLDTDQNKKSRKGKAFDSFRRVNLSEDLYTGLLEMTNKMTDSYVPCIEGGIFTDDCFVSFFKDLDMQIRFVWEKKANVFYLTPRIIRSENYTNGVLYRKLLGTFLNELTDKSFLTDFDHRPPLLYDSEGQIINNCYQVRDQDGKYLPARLSPQVEALFQAIYYMVFRSNLHLIAARELGAELILSPLRTVFQWGCYHYFYLGNQGAIPSMASVISGSVHCPTAILHGIPKFVFWITEHMNCENGFIKAAFELREEKEFAVLRRSLNDRSEKSNEQLARIFKKYRVDAKKGLTSAVTTRTPGMPEPSKISALPSFPLRPDQDQADGEAGWDKGQHFSITFRSIRDDMLRLDEIPEYFDVITSKIQYKPEAVLQNIKVETNKTSDDSRPWEIPM